MANFKFSGRRHFNLLVQKDDPIVAFSLPRCLVGNLKEITKKSRRKLSTEIIVRLAHTLEAEQSYIIIEPLVRLDYLNTQVYQLSTFKVFKAESLKKAINDQLAALKDYFHKKSGFMKLEQRFPKELWQAAQIDALEKGQTIEEAIAIRMAATIEEPELFNLPKRLTSKSYKGC